MSDSHYFDPTKPRGEAVNLDGTLKDAQDILFYNDPSDERPINPIPSTSDTASPAMTFTFVADGPAAEKSRKRRGTESTAQSAPPAKKSASTSTSATKPNQPSKKAVDRVLNLSDPSSASSIAAPVLKASRKEAGNDILTVFEKLEKEDGK